MAVPERIVIPKTVVLSHRPHQQPVATPMDAIISVEDGVKWEYFGNWVVVFENESPFHSYNFFPGNDTSGPPKDDVKHNHPYKYSVYIEGDKLDPVVIIRP
jgi:hypothetical protein